MRESGGKRERERERRIQVFTMRRIDIDSHCSVNAVIIVNLKSFLIKVYLSKV